MVEADVRVIHDGVLVTARIANTLHTASKDKSISLLLVFLADSFQWRQLNFGCRAIKSIHHQLKARFGYSGKLLYLLVEILESEQRSFRVVTVIEQLLDFRRQAWMNVPALKWMQDRRFCGRLRGLVLLLSHHTGTRDSL